MMRKAVFLDRDGVINRKAAEGTYVTNVADLVLLPGVADAIASLNNAGYLVLVATNQRGIARGALDFADLELIHRAIRERLQAMGAVIDGFYVCPHEGGCGCRKPAPDLLLQAAREHQLDLSLSWMVGDSSSDVDAGRAAGCRTVAVGRREDHGEGEFFAADLVQAVAVILKADGLGKHSGSASVPSRRAPSAWKP